MSADNWTYCPSCKSAELARRQQARKKVEASYGKVSADAYLESINALREAEQEPYKETLREDYSIGITDGTFSVEYRGGCTECTFEYEYTVETNPPIGNSVARVKPPPRKAR